MPKSKMLIKNSLVCSGCLVSDHFFVGGGSWAPDYCPKCGGTACTLFQNLTPLQRHSAERLMQKMWTEKYKGGQKTR